MRKKLYLLLGFLTIMACQKADIVETPNMEGDKSKKQQRVPKEILEKLKKLSFNTQNVQFFRSDETKSDFYTVGDIVLSGKQIMEMQSSDITTKQYRTYNLVNNNRIIKVFGYSSGTYALSLKEQAALADAVKKYNYDLCTGLKFEISFGSNPVDQDIEVVSYDLAHNGAQAVFPENGNPGDFIYMDPYMNNFSQSHIARLFLHELGHTVGLRHTDWYSRESCGGTGEGADSIGAVHIPGTPTDFDSKSVMLSCFDYSLTGFGIYDKNALEYLYPVTGSMSTVVTGPSKGDNSGYYTWTANVENGGAGIYYDWKYSYDGLSYNSTFGKTESVSAYLPINKDFYLKLIVTSACGSDVSYRMIINTDAIDGSKP